MLGALKNIRPQERTLAWGAFFTLLGFMTGHAALETARDALFLAKIPASQLPWVYLAIAAIALLITQIQQRLGGGGPLTLSGLLGIASLVTAAFWMFLGRAGPGALYALYVWSGVLATLVMVQFWTVLGSLFTVSQAKRLYAVIGAGSVVGAIAGTGLARVMTAVTEPHNLLGAAAVAFLLSALGPLLALRTGQERAAPEKGTPVRRMSLTDSIRRIVESPYATRVAALAMGVALKLTAEINRSPPYAAAA